MNDRIASIVCPNCGASSTNRNKCEFCGSVLVRFADKDVQNLEEKFGQSVRIIPGLDLALEENLSLQESCTDDSIIITRIFPSKEDRSDIKANEFAWKVIRSSERKRMRMGIRYRTPKAKTSFGTDYYEIVSAKDALFGSQRGDLANRDLVFLLRFPFSNNNTVEISTYNVYCNPNAADPDKIISCSPDHHFPYNSEYEFRKNIDFDGMFRPYKYENGMYYILDLGQDVESAARIATHYISRVDEGGFWSYDRNIFTFETETVVINKADAIIDPITGNIVRKDEIEQTPPKKSFWEKIFG